MPLYPCTWTQLEADSDDSGGYVVFQAPEDDYLFPNTRLFFHYYYAMGGPANACALICMIPAGREDELYDYLIYIMSNAKYNE